MSSRGIWRQNRFRRLCFASALAAAILFAPTFRLVGLGSIIGYFVAGVVVGPSSSRLISDARMTLNISQLGVILLLFLIGLSLKPQRLYASPAMTQVGIVPRGIG